MRMMQAPRRSEVGIIAAMTAAALLLSSAPYLYAYLSPPPGTVFSGFVYNVQDMNSYLAKMAQGARGDWLFHLPFTAQPHDGTFVNTLFLLLGKLSAIAGLPLVLTFHLARLVFGAAMLASAYLFIRYFLPGSRERLVAFALVCFSSGAGWLMLISGTPPGFTAMPIDFWVPDAFTFLVLFSFPHMALSEALLLWVFLLGLESLRRNSIRCSVGAGVALALAGLVHPFCIPIAGVALALYTLVLWLQGFASGGTGATLGVLPGHLKHLTVTMVMSLPVFAYNLYAFRANPVLENWSIQNIFPSPHPVQLLVSFGLLGILAAYGGYLVLRQSDDQSLFLVIWVVAAFLLAYLPVSIQRRLLEGVHIPLSMLAAVAMVALLGHKGMPEWQRLAVKQVRALPLVAVILLMSVSNLILVGGNIAQLSQKSPWVFPPLWQVDAADWLKRNGEYGGVVLSSLETGNYLAARAGSRVVLGHNVETINYLDTEKTVQRFYDSSASDDWRRAMVGGFGVSYVYLGPFERQLGAFDPSRSSLFTRVYSNSQVSIYEVNPPLAGR